MYADWTTQSRFVCGVKTVVIPGGGVKSFAAGGVSVVTPPSGDRSSAAADVMFSGESVSVFVPAKAIKPTFATVPVVIAAAFRSRIASSSQSSVVSCSVS